MPGFGLGREECPLWRRTQASPPLMSVVCRTEATTSESSPEPLARRPSPCAWLQATGWAAVARGLGRPAAGPGRTTSPLRFQSRSGCRLVESEGPLFPGLSLSLLGSRLVADSTVYAFRERHFSVAAKRDIWASLREQRGSTREETVHF